LQVYYLLSKTELQMRLSRICNSVLVCEHFMLTKIVFYFYNIG